MQETANAQLFIRSRCRTVNRREPASGSDEDRVQIEGERSRQVEGKRQRRRYGGYAA